LNKHRHSIFEYFQTVKSKVVNFVDQEHISNAIFGLGKGRDCRKKVAITKLTLLDIIWLNLSLKDM